MTLILYKEQQSNKKSTNNENNLEKTTNYRIYMQ